MNICNVLTYAAGIRARRWACRRCPAFPLPRPHLSACCGPRVALSPSISQDFSLKIQFPLGNCTDWWWFGLFWFEQSRDCMVNLTGEDFVSGEIGKFHRLQTFHRWAHFTDVTGYKQWKWAQNQVSSVCLLVNTIQSASVKNLNKNLQKFWYHGILCW